MEIRMGCIRVMGCCLTVRVRDEENYAGSCRYCAGEEVVFVFEELGCPNHSHFIFALMYSPKIIILRVPHTHAK
jgi:hypothetical protein